MSLAARVSAFFLAALALVLAGFSASLYLLARAHLSSQVDERLGGALDTLAAAAEVESDGVDWEPEEHSLAPEAAGGPAAVRWEICDGEGRLVDRSSNLDSRALGEDPRPAAIWPGDGAREAARDGAPWRLAWRTLRPAGAAKPNPPPERHASLRLMAAVSLAPMNETLRLLAVTLAGLSVGLWLAAAAAGRWACRWALAPVTRMAAAARAMDATEPGQSLPGPGTRDELDDLARAFNGLLARMQEAFERQRRFTGDASHQLRTPLTALLGQVEVALRRDRPAEEYRRVLAQVHGQAEGLHGIVEALLFLARADAEALLPGAQAVDLSAWLPELPARWAGHDRAPDLRLGLPAAGPLWVRVQPALLGMLVDNLVDNALKYGEPGSPVTLSATREGGAIALAVEDAGPGIAEGDMPHVFEPFYRSAEARGLGRAGVGLGLAVAQRLAAAFGGSLMAESKQGRGSRFTLRLPPADAAACAGPPTSMG